MFPGFISFRMKVFPSILIAIAFFTFSCSAQQTEEQALQSLRQMTKDSQLPPESVVANIESRFSGRRTGVLAKLLRARIRFENKDYIGAAAILNSNDFREKTTLADYALWLRGRALQNAGNHAEAMNVFAKLQTDFPDSIRLNDAKMLWAESAIQSGQAARVPDHLLDLTRKQSGEALSLIHI